MATHEFTVESSLSVDDAFARTADLRRVDQWDRGVTNPNQIDGEGVAVGSRYEVTVTGFDGAPTQIVYELTEVEAPRRFVMVGEHEQFRAHDTLEFEPSDGGCVLTYVGSLELLGPNKPLDDDQLDGLFVKIAGVAQSGLAQFLNPD